MHILSVIQHDVQTLIKFFTELGKTERMHGPSALPTTGHLLSQASVEGAGNVVCLRG